MFSKPIAKLKRKSNLWCQSGILCTRSWLISAISKNILGKRFWLEHVCKVCAPSVLLLRFCSDSWCEAVLEPSTTLRRFGIYFLLFLYHITSFWMPESQYRWAFIGNCYIWLQVFGGVIFHVFAGVQIMMIFSRSLSSKVVQNSFWRPWALLGLLGGSLCSLLFLAGLGFFFSSFWQVSKSGRFSRGVCLPKCS